MKKKLKRKKSSVGNQMVREMSHRIKNRVPWRGREVDMIECQLKKQIEFRIFIFSSFGFSNWNQVSSALVDLGRSRTESAKYVFIINEFMFISAINYGVANFHFAAFVCACVRERGVTVRVLWKIEFKVRTQINEFMNRTVRVKKATKTKSRQKIENYSLFVVLSIALNLSRFVSFAKQWNSFLCNCLPLKLSCERVTPPISYFS